MGRIIGVANLKGGVGKSTLAVNLAACLAESHGAAIVDADDQATATEWVRAGELKNLEILVLPLDDGRDAGNWSAAIRNISREFVIIDLPPHSGTSTAAALLISDLLLIPVTPSGVDLRATAKAIGMLHEARAARGDARPKALLVPSKVDRRTAAGRQIEAALHEFGEPVGPAIGLRTAFVESGTLGTWIGAYAPNTTAHNEIESLAAVVERLTR